MRNGEQWRDIPGYDGWYQASNLGRVRSWKGTGGKDHLTFRLAEPNILLRKNVKGSYCVALRRSSEHPKYIGVARLVWITFHGEPPTGYLVTRKDKQFGESLDNITLKTRAQMSREISKGRSSGNRKPVVKLNTGLDVVAAYPSARQAEIVNHYSVGGLRPYLNLRSSSAIAPDGYIYAQDDDAWMRRTLRRAKAELEAKGIRFTAPATEEYYNLPPDPLDGLDMEAIPWADVNASRGGTVSEP